MGLALRKSLPTLLDPASPRCAAVHPPLIPVPGPPCRERHLQPPASAGGFTLLELMVVIALLAVLLTIAAPWLAAYVEQGRKANCLSNRYHIEQDERSQYLSANSVSLAIDGRYRCPTGGVYAWLISDPTNPGYPGVGCSIHYGQVSAPLTSLGSDFTEISTAMIALIRNYYTQNGRYPRSWASYGFTDLGLDPAEWDQPINGLLYSPGGSNVSIRPTEGTTLRMQSLDGATLTLTARLNWNLFYSVPDGQWYYHTRAPQNAVDIGTLQIIRN